MIDIAKEKPLSLSDATAFVPKRRGKRVSATTLWRWIVYGKQGVFLEALKTPGGWFTSAEALQRFYEAITKADGRGDVNRPQPPERNGVTLSQEWADKILNKAGI